ncbi:hypothetical protein IHV25_07545 [Phaeovibrio sulfidiphilus]|uniref:Uncharacterized protein n=1 Tax=Phaeovibrio sulfidiphilus TaxID=1220600 RepID=A0A8J7CR67_9PROT|nr:hypothetical protein [Phaeovibrio sulfidiphilus]MBE1237500.1 hypothetical protein [Phaeovibrio sulfidiphilus]
MALSRPTEIPRPFAEGGDKNSIPDTQVTDYLASFVAGFPPRTSLPVAAGGVPPTRSDINGILNHLSQFALYQQSGGTFEWSSGRDYAVRCEVYGSDGKKYVALAESGPGTGTGPRDPVQDSPGTCWKILETGGLDVSRIPRFSETVWGLGRLATVAEARAGSDTACAVTPAGLAGALGSATGHERHVLSASGRWTAPAAGTVVVTLVSEGKDGESVTVQGGQSLGGCAGPSGYVVQKTAAVARGDVLDVVIGQGGSWTAGALTRTSCSGLVSIPPVLIQGVTEGAGSPVAASGQKVLACRPGSKTDRAVALGPVPIAPSGPAGGVGSIPLILGGVMVSTPGETPFEKPYAYGAGGNGGTVGVKGGAGEPGEQGVVVVDFFRRGL